MRTLVVSSPHGFTTRDVWQRVLKGMGQNGAEVVPFDLLPRFRIFDWMLTQATRRKVELPAAFKSNILAYEPVFGAAHHHECDAVMIVSPQYCPTPLIDMLKKAGKKTIAYFTECPYEDTLIAPLQAQHFDYIAVSDRNSVGLFQSFAPNVFYLPHSYDPAIHYPAGEQPPVDLDTSESEASELEPRADGRVVYVGTLYKGRRKLLYGVNWEGIPFDLYGMHYLSRRSKLWRHLRGELTENEATAEIYRRGIASFNMHRTQRYGFLSLEIDRDEAYSAGPRVYELAACETFQASDHRQEVIDIFGDTVPIYQTPKELERILRRAVDDPVWRSELAAKQREAVQGRDCKVSMARLLEAVA